MEDNHLNNQGLHDKIKELQEKVDILGNLRKRKEHKVDLNVILRISNKFNNFVGIY
jgi:hypothetical protein